MQHLAIILGMLAMSSAGLTRAAASIQTEQLGIELVSESTTLVPGTTAQLGLHLRHAPGWHTYWINPGDSGLPTRLNWSLAGGYRADDIDWPVPKRFNVGGIANFGYDADVLLPVSLHVPEDAKPGSRANLAVEARWLVCHEECIPGRASPTLDLPVTRKMQIGSRWHTAFATARAAQPQGEPLRAAAHDTGDRIEVEMPHGAFAGATSIDAFAVQTKIVANSPPAIASRDGDIVLIFAKSDYFTSIPDALDLIVVPARGSAQRAHATFSAPGTPPQASQ